MKLTDEQIKIRALGDEINLKAREKNKPKAPTAEDVVNELNSGEKSPLLLKVRKKIEKLNKRLEEYE